MLDQKTQKIQISLGQRGRLELATEGAFTLADNDQIAAIVASAFKWPTPPRELAFNLSSADPIHNIAGRMYDLGVFCSRDYKIPVELTLPEETFHIIFQLQSHYGLQQRGDLEFVTSDNIVLKINDSDQAKHLISREADADGYGVLEQHAGEVEDLQGDNVHVMLRSEDYGLIYGELPLKSFQSVTPKKGAKFAYIVKGNANGAMLTVIEPLRKTEPSDDEILDRFAQLDSAFSGDF